ncbi:DUF2971 domain-containing protein [Parerythrobacter jejuensis]|uniref:DUF2971 domain-containing protein n=1 Tax=Parerythrobacter jejuensis TaxID=795812 RepID=A0A845AUD3_9SPHN|nr:DUF2971 domain-containing protein [Parerythrobacter jejuensis]MXP32116.1 hypothetical protein [Parerythrobacter jejuensis]
MADRRLANFVRRYTTLSSALETLKQDKLVLLSPSKWDDSNDTFLMDLYRSQVEARSVLAMCCTMARETYHHWRVFTDGIEGICIEFKRAPLEDAISGLASVRAGPVEYLKVKELRELGPDQTHRLPFIKRDGYAAEIEWRIVAECDEVHEFKDIAIQKEWINSITFNPWMPPSLVSNLRDIIRTIAPDANFSLRASSLTNSKQWKDAGRGLVAKPV